MLVIIADCGDADEQPEEYTCGICGFVMNEARECPRCKMQNERDGRELDDRKKLSDEIDEFFGATE